MEQSSKEKVAKEETPDKAPDYKNWGRMSEIIGKQLVAIAGFLKDTLCGMPGGEDGQV